MYKWTLRALMLMILAASSSATAYCLDHNLNVESAAVTADTAGIVADAQKLAKTPMNPKPRTPRNYSKEDALEVRGSQTVVLDGDSLYFIEGGSLFEKNFNSGRVSLLPDASSVKSILIFKKKLVALQNTGHIFVRYPFAEKWIHIGFNAQQILATDADLLALTRDSSQYMRGSQLWIYKDQPGTKRLGRDPSFFDVGLRNVAAINHRDVAGAKDIEIKFKDGRSVLFSMIKSSIY